MLENQKYLELLLKEKDKLDHASSYKFYLNHNFTIELVKQVNLIELYSIPVLSTLGIIGNIMGAICILKNINMRKHINLFFVSIMGIFDCIWLVTQLQRWFALFVNNNAINNKWLCKLFFFFNRLSLVTSILILFALATAKVLRFKSKYTLYTPLGQLFSKLSVVLSICIGFSFSWNELWTSGILLNENVALKQNFKLPKCVRNMNSIMTIDLLNYFLNGLTALMLVSQLISAFLLVYKQFNRKKELNNRCIQRQKGFVVFIIISSFTSGICDLPLVILNLIKYSPLRGMCSNRLTTYLELVKSDDDLLWIFGASLTRLAIILSTLSHSLKFYFLFLCHSKFRHEIFSLIGIKYDFNLKILADLTRKNDKRKRPQMDSFFSCGNSIANNSNNNFENDSYTFANIVHDNFYSTVDSE
jgi:hypothetical protein